MTYQLQIYRKNKLVKKLSVAGNYKLSENFMVSEIACHDGSPVVKVKQEQIDAGQLLRDTIGLPMDVSSGYRTETYNAECGGIDKSEHTKGGAWDIKVKGMSPFEVAKSADSLHLFNGIGVYQTFTHVDVGTYKGYWYQNASGHKTFYSSLEKLRIAVFGKSK